MIIVLGNIRLAKQILNAQYVIFCCYGVSQSKHEQKTFGDVVKERGFITVTVAAVCFSRSGFLIIQD